MQLKASLREITTSPKTLRAEGKLPAVVYGHNIKNQNLTVNAVEFEKIFRHAGESTIVDLVTDDGKSHPVIIQDVQYHTLSHSPIHADFYVVSMTEKLKASIPFDFIGEAPAVKTLGGILFKQLSEVSVECLPADLPHNIPVELSSLKNLNDAIHIKDLVVSSKIKLLAPQDEVIVKVQPPRDIEKELAPAETDEKAAVEAVVAATDAEKAKAAAEKEEAKTEESK